MPEVWVMAGPNPNHFVDGTDQFARKVAALRAHESQTGHMDELTEMLQNWMTLTAERGSLPKGRLAEMFQVVATA